MHWGANTAFLLQLVGKQRNWELSFKFPTRVRSPRLLKATNLFLQIEREPRPFPTLKIKRTVSDIDDFKFDDFDLVGYKPHPKIKMEMAV